METVAARIGAVQGTDRQRSGSTRTHIHFSRKSHNRVMSPDASRKVISNARASLRLVTLSQRPKSSDTETGLLSICEILVRNYSLSCHMYPATLWCVWNFVSLDTALPADRKIFTRTSDGVSQNHPLLLGIPHGDVLCPVLFQCCAVRAP